MVNESLTYKKGAKKTFAEGYFNRKFASTPKNVSASEAFVYDVANDQREFFKPIFANETKYLPNVRGSELVSNYSQTLDAVSKPLSIESISPLSNESRKRNESSKQFKSGFPNKESLTIPPNKRKADDVIKFIVIGGALFLVYKILTD
jgi:hypothetical protein